MACSVGKVAPYQLGALFLIFILGLVSPVFGANLCTISGPVLDASGTGIPNATVVFNAPQQSVQGQIVPGSIVSSVTDTAGNLNPIPLLQGLYVQVTVNLGVPTAAIVPLAANASLSSMLSGLGVTGGIFTAGSVMFSAGGSGLDEDVGRFVYNKTNHRLQVGGLSPTTQMRLSTSTPSERSLQVDYAGDDSQSYTFQSIKYRGTFAVPSPVQNNDGLFAQLHFGAAGSATALAALTQVISEGSPGASSIPGRWSVATSPVGSPTPVERVIVHANGDTQIGNGFYFVNQVNRLGLGINGPGSQLHLRTGQNTENALSVEYIASDVSPYSLNAFKARGGVGAPASVANGDGIFAENGLGFDGTNQQFATQIAHEVDGTPGPGVMPGRIRFSVSQPGQATPTERLRIDSGGRLILSNASAGSSVPGELILQNSKAIRGANVANNDSVSLIYLNTNNLVTLGQHYFIRKPTNETRTTTTTVAPDAILGFALGANETYQIEMNLVIQSGAGFRWAPSFPAGGFSGLACRQAGNGIGGFSTGTPQGITTDPVDFLFCWGYVTASATPGNWTLNWAQNVPSGTTTLTTESWLLARRIN